MLGLQVWFRRDGMQSFVFDEDDVRVWNGSVLVIALSGAVLRQLVTHYLAGASIQGHLAQQMDPRKPPAKVLESKIPGPRISTEQRAALKRGRRSRRRRTP